MASTYVVERSTTIHSSREVLFDHVVKFTNWPAWSPWEELDPNMTKTYTGVGGAVGSHFSWSGNRKAGRGSMTVTSAEAPGSMTADLEFLKPFKSSNKMGFTLTPDTTSTTVTWRMEAPHNLMTRIMGAFGLIERQVGKDFEKGLASLKALVE